LTVGTDRHIAIQSQSMNPQYNEAPHDVPFVKTIKIGVLWDVKSCVMVNS